MLSEQYFQGVLLISPPSESLWATASSALAVKDAASYTGVATNGALTAQATIQWSAASASDIITCDQFIVEVIG